MQKYFADHTEFSKIAALPSFSEKIEETNSFCSKKPFSFFQVIDFFLHLEQRFSNRFMAVAYMMISNILYTLLSLLTKISSDIPPYQLVYNRACYEIILSFATIVLMKGIIFTKNPQTYKLLLIRGFLGGMGLTMYFHAIYYLPISICVVLFMLTPLWIGIVTSVKEKKFDKLTFLCMLGSFIGMTLIIKPGFRDKDENGTGGQIGFYIGAFLAIMTSILSGIVFFSIKTLKGKTEIATIVLYFNGFNLLFSAIGQIFEGIKVLSWHDHFTLMTIGLFGWFAQMLRSRALMLEKVFFVSVLMYMQIALSYLVDVFILKIEFDLYSNIGCLIIGTTMIGLIYINQNEK